MTTSDALSTASAQVMQAATEFQWDGNGFEAGIVAASGGGFRAMLFHAGAFMRLNELGLLRRASQGARLPPGTSVTFGTNSSETRSRISSRPMLNRFLLSQGKRSTLWAYSLEGVLPCG